jgi:type II secretory pathway component PulL
MARPILIIDIGRDSLTGGVVSPGHGEVKQFFESSLRDGLKEALASLLREMNSAGFVSFGRVYLGVPAKSLTMRIVSIPLDDKKKVEEVLPFELEERLIRDSDNFVFDAVALSEGKAMAVALEKPLLREYLDTFAGFGLEPFWVGSSLLAKERLLAKVNDMARPAVFIDRESLIISDGKEPILYKRINDDMDVRLALASVEGGGLDELTFYYCGEAAGAFIPEGRSGVAVCDWDERFTGLFALALQIKGGLKGAVNFRKGEFANTEAFDRAKKGFRVTVALLLLIAGLWGALVYLQSRSMAEEMADIKAELTNSYKRAFPADTVVQDPFYQLEIKLKEQEGDMGVMGMGVNVLENLRLLSAAGGSAGITFYELSMSGQRVTAKGRAASFEQTEKFKKELLKQKAFLAPALTDVKKSFSGGVTFAIALELKG